MKKLFLLLSAFLLTTAVAMAQSVQRFDFPAFDNVDLDGNVRLYIKQGDETKVEIEARRASHIDEYRIEVRGNTLYVQYDNRSSFFSSTPKIEVYLTHPGIEGIDMDGLVHVVSKNTITTESLYIKGDGLIKGTIDVDVARLHIDLDGLCTMTVVGNAEETDLRLDGMGKIHAKELHTNTINKSADGLASIRVGS